jgi:hypothetical protein
MFHVESGVRLFHGADVRSGYYQKFDPDKQKNKGHFREILRVGCCSIRGCLCLGWWAVAQIEKWYPACRMREGRWKWGTFHKIRKFRF